MKKTFFAVGLQIAIMILVIIPPYIVRAIGETVYLETEKMDPRSIFRGNFAILGYKAAQGIVSQEMSEESRKFGKPVYVQFTTDRPAKFVSVSLEKPEYEEGRVCIAGRVRGWGGWNPDGSNNESVDFPQIAQFFTTAEEAKAIEDARGENLLAKVKTTKGCNAQLVGMELK